MDVKHTVNGLRCTIDSVHAVTHSSPSTPQADVWVAAEDLPRALRTIGKLSDEKFPKPEVYTSPEEGRPVSEKVCMVLK